MTDRFSHTTYLIRQKILQVFGRTFHVFDPSGQVVFYAKLKAFKLKEDIRLYTGEDMQTEVLLIKARQIVDFAAAYDVHDPATGEKVGALKRKGLKSIIKDEWIFMDTQDREIGLIQEDSMFLALVRRLLFSFLPQTFHGMLGGTHVMTLKQNWNPFVSKLSVDFSPDAADALDRRLGIAAAILLCAIEGKQG